MKIFSSKTSKQTLLLFGSQILMVIIGFGIKAIQTKYLGPEGYGVYAFFGSFTVFTALFFRFGFFSSLQVLLAENVNPTTEREFFGLGFLINLVVGVLYAIFIFIFSFFIDSIFSTEIGDILRLVSPLTIILPTRSLISAMSIGSNKIHILPIYDNLSKFFFVIVLLLFAYSGTLNVFITIVFNLITLLFSFFVIYRQFQPLFTNLRVNLSKLWEKTKGFGFNFYLGSTANQSTFKLDELVITFFHGTTANGFYSLANVIGSPMVMGSQALSNSLFKEFTHKNKIPAKVFIYNTAWLVVSIIGLYFLAEWVVDSLFGLEFNLVSKYAIGLSVAFFFQGLYQPFNFLSAKSQGKAVRNVALIEAFINLAGNLLLIPILGVAGAIYTSILAKFIHFMGKLYYYKKYLQKQSING